MATSILAGGGAVTVNERTQIFNTLNALGASLAGEITSPIQDANRNEYQTTRAMRAFYISEKILIKSRDEGIADSVIHTDQVVTIAQNIFTTNGGIVLNPTVKDDVVDNAIEEAFNMGRLIKAEYELRNTTVAEWPA